MYFLNLILLIIICIINRLFNKSKSTYFLFAALIYLSIFDAVRINTGTDWAMYSDHFNAIASNDFIENEIFEMGYVWIEKIISIFSNSYNALLLIVAISTYWLLYLNIYLCTRTIVFLPILYSTITPFLGSNRQMIALGVLSFSIKYIVKKEFIPFFIIVLISSYIHISALIFILIYILNLNLVKNIYIYTIVFFSFIIFALNINISDYVMIFYNIVSGKLQFYVGEPAQESNILYGVLKLITYIVLPLCFLRYFNSLAIALKDQLFMLSFRALTISIGLYVLSFCGFLILNSRVNIYFFSFFLPIYYSVSYKIIFTLNKKISLYFLIIIFSISLLQLYLGFKSYHDLFFPYESIFSDPPYKLVY
jgi:EpsG family